MAVTYTVKSGDSLSGIASRYKSQYAPGMTTAAYTAKLAEWSNIENPNRIWPGDVIYLDGPASGANTKKNPSFTPGIKRFQPLPGSERDMYCSWTFDQSDVEEYEVRYWWSWGVGESPSETQKTKNKWHEWSIPSHATHATVSVRAIAKNKEGTETPAWTGSWSKTKTYYVSSNAPTASPSQPSLSVKGSTLTAEVTGIPNNVTSVEFQFALDDEIVATRTGAVKTNRAVCEYVASSSGLYKVQCKYVNANGKSANWSDWSESKTPAPVATKGIKTIRAESETSIYLDWDTVTGAESYDIEYATNKDAFDITNDTTPVNGITTTRYTVTGLDSGFEYFFRIRAVNSEGESAWSAIKSTVIGTKPAAPQTWAYTTTAIVGEEVILYWVHNSEDNSEQTSAQVELTIGGSTTIHPVDTSTYAFSTSGYVEGAKLLWRVRTKGIIDEYGDWSVQRVVNIYAPPSLALTLTDGNGNDVELLERFPLHIQGATGPVTQEPIGYHISVVADSAYETVDYMGRPKVVSAGTTIYSKYFDISDELSTELSASDIDLENNAAYTLTCVVSMNSGLTATESRAFVVAWEDNQYVPNAEITVNREAITTSIVPYCNDLEGEPIPGILLSVYRREFDGTFTELTKDLDSLTPTTITDPHPALDYARYRIVATTKDTGAVSYYDLPGIPVQEKAIVIQWDETWSDFDVTEYPTGDRPWTGSMLKLPYNVDVSEENSPDVSLVKYIGRSHPVSYYGTHLGSSASWNCEIPKDDAETIYALRRLAIWMGDVYVREPSGTGYWANITVSFSQKHCEVTIPVSLSITRVAGGV